MKYVKMGMEGRMWGLLGFEVSVDGMRLEHVSEFKYLFVLDEPNTDDEVS